MKIVYIGIAAGALLTTNAFATGDEANVRDDARASYESSWHGYARPDAAAVKDLQRRLKAQGYDAGAVDGIMGPRTRAALRDFQRDHGAAASADLGPGTVASLGMYEPAVGATASASGSRAVGMQRGR